MATAAAIRQRIYDNLYGSFPTEAPFVTTLTASYTDAEGVIDVLDEAQWNVGDVLENTETGEQMKVLSVTTDGSDICTVVHGWNGTSTAASVGTDDVLYKNPRFTQEALNKAVTAVLADLEKWGIHTYGAGTITRADPKVYYELSDTDIMDTYGVLRAYTVLANSEIAATLVFRYIRETGTGPSEYGQGQGIQFGDFGNTSDTDTIHYVYAKLIEAVTALETRQEELVVVGATALLMGQTIVKATHDPGARTDRTTPPGQTSRDVRYFQGRFFSEARLEAAQLSVERQKMMRMGVRQSRASRWVS